MVEYPERVGSWELTAASKNNTGPPAPTNYRLDGYDRVFVNIAPVQDWAPPDANFLVQVNDHAHMETPVLGKFDTEQEAVDAAVDWMEDNVPDWLTEGESLTRIQG